MRFIPNEQCDAMLARKAGERAFAMLSNPGQEIAAQSRCRACRKACWRECRSSRQLPPFYVPRTRT